MNKKLIIIGASGHGKVIADIALKMNRWESIDFLDDHLYSQNVMDLNVVGKTEDSRIYKEDSEFCIAIGNNMIRSKIQLRLISEGYTIISMIHPTAIIASDVVIGIGTVIMAGSIINSSSRIGDGCIINTGAIIEHDNLIGDFVHISPGVKTAGTVKIGDHSWLGIGTVVSNNLEIESNCQFGAGSVVIKDIIESGRYVGVPVRRIDK